MAGRRPHDAFRRVAFIGLGLIRLLGLAIGAARRGEIVAFAAAPSRAKALELGLSIGPRLDPAEAVAGADLVVLCVPPAAVGPVAAAMPPGLARGAIVSDVGSIKAQIVRDVVPHLPEPGPSSRRTGRRHRASGPERASPRCSSNRRCILTPPEDTDPTAVARGARALASCRREVETMTPEHHDRVLAITSHLPHLIAYTIVGTAADLEEHPQSEVIKYSAGGFPDFTRIAASDPTCGATCSSTTARRCSRCSTASPRTSPRCSARSAGATATLFELFSRTRAIRRA